MSFLRALDSLDWSAFAARLSDSADADWPRPDSAVHLRDRAAVSDSAGLHEVAIFGEG